MHFILFVKRFDRVQGAGERTNYLHTQQLSYQYIYLIHFSNFHLCNIYLGAFYIAKSVSHS